MKKENVGSSFDSWLWEEELYEEATSVAVKRVLARQISAYGVAVTKPMMAKRIQLAE